MTKQKKLSASLEDYLEAIYLIIREQGMARSREIMKHLGVSGPSVTEALQLLSNKGMIYYQPYESVTLTPLGENIARDVLHRHETLRDFFIEVLGIDTETADKGACRMEHVASANIIERMIKYTNYQRAECHRRGCSRSHCFEEYLQKLEDGQDSAE